MVGNTEKCMLCESQEDVSVSVTDDACQVAICASCREIGQKESEDHAEMMMEINSRKECAACGDITKESHLCEVCFQKKSYKKYIKRSLIDFKVVIGKSQKETIK